MVGQLDKKASGKKYGDIVLAMWKKNRIRICRMKWRFIPQTTDRVTQLEMYMTENTAWVNMFSAPGNQEFFQEILPARSWWAYEI